MTRAAVTKENPLLMQRLISTLSDLYITRRDKYLIQMENGYSHCYKGKRSYTNGRPLVDSMIKEHIEGKNTYGVFCYKETKFLTFDFDFEGDYDAAKKYYYRLRETLIFDLNIPYDKIYASSSGNKGIHLDIFFSTPVPLEIVTELYEFALQKAGLYHLKHKIEQRPTDKQGVKLPLGIHKKTGKRCYFLNPHNLDEEMPLEYVLSISPLDSDYFLNEIIPAMREDIEYMTDEEVLERSREIMSRVQSLDIYELFQDEEVTHDHFIRLYEEGLTVKGTRHHYTLMLSIFFKSQYGMDKQQVTDIMCEWIQRQPQSMMDTPKEKAVEITKEIVSKVFKYDYSFSLKKQEITFTIEELRTILTAKNEKGKQYTPNQKALLFAITGHSKRYANKDGKFYMTYAQMTKLTGIKKREHLISAINSFVESELLIIHRRNATQEGTYKKMPNIYEVRLVNKEKDVSHLHEAHVTIADYDVITFKKVVSELFTKQDIQNMMSRHQAKKFVLVCG